MHNKIFIYTFLIFLSCLTSIQHSSQSESEKKSALYEDDEVEDNYSQDQNFGKKSPEAKSQRKEKKCGMKGISPKMKRRMRCK